MAWLLVLWTAAPTIESVAADTLVIAPAPFCAALQPWIAHRTQQGRRVQLAVAATSTEANRAAIRQVGRQGRLKSRHESVSVSPTRPSRPTNTFDS